MSMVSGGDDESEHLLLHIDSERPHGSFHDSSVHSHECLFSLVDLDFPCAVWVHAAMVEDFPTIQQIKPFYELCHFRVIDDGDIEEPVVWHRIGSEAVTLSVSDADGHHLPVDDIGIDA